MGKAKKTKSWFSKIPRDVKESFLDSCLDNMDCSSGLWMDRGKAEDILPGLIEAAQFALGAEIEDSANSVLLQKVCAAQPLSPGEITAEYIGKPGHRLANIDDTDPECVPYIELCIALCQPAYLEVTLQKINEYYQDTFPKLSHCVEQYKRCVLNKGSKDEARDILYRLYIGNSMGDLYTLVAAVYMMGYAGWKSSLRLPFRCMLDRISNVSKNIMNQNSDARLSYPHVCMLFDCFDNREQENKENGNVQKLVDDLKNAGRISSCAKLASYCDEPADGTYMTCKELFQSKYFAKYYKNRRAALCKKMDCSDKELEGVFRNQFKHACTPEQYRVLLHLGSGYNIQPSALYEIMMQQSKNSSEENTDDTDEWIVPVYYMYKLENALVRRVGKNTQTVENITRRELYNELGADNVEEDICFFSQIWIYEMLLGLANKEKQEWYRNFDFFENRQLQSSQIMELRRDVSKYKNLAEQKDRDVASLTRKLGEKRIKAPESDIEKKLRIELAQADREKESLEDENRELKQKVSELNEYVEIVEKAMSESQAETVTEPDIKKIDEAALHSVRIAFVCGDADQICPDLRKSFPGSVIHETATQRAALKKTTDLVVYFTRHISHTMFFRFRSAYEGIPEYFYNGTNIDKLKEELSMYIKNRETKI